MQKGYVPVYFGEGRGKTTSAIGQGLKAIGDGLKVIMVRFLDGNKIAELEPLRRFEPEFKVFRFSKQREDGTEPSRQEMQMELTTAFQFGKKIIETGECDVLILDGVMDAVAENFLSGKELCQLVARRPEYMEVLVTGEKMVEPLEELADNVYQIETIKERL